MLVDLFKFTYVEHDCRELKCKMHNLEGIANPERYKMGIYYCEKGNFHDCDACIGHGNGACELTGRVKEYAMVDEIKYLEPDEVIRPMSTKERMMKKKETSVLKSLGCRRTRKTKVVKQTSMTRDEWLLKHANERLSVTEIIDASAKETERKAAQLKKIGLRKKRVKTITKQLRQKTPSEFKTSEELFRKKITIACLLSKFTDMPPPQPVQNSTCEHPCKYINSAMFKWSPKVYDPKYFVCCHGYVHTCVCSNLCHVTRRKCFDIDKLVNPEISINLRSDLRDAVLYMRKMLRRTKRDDHVCIIKNRDFYGLSAWFPKNIYMCTECPRVHICLPGCSTCDNSTKIKLERTSTDITTQWNDVLNYYILMLREPSQQLIFDIFMQKLPIYISNFAVKKRQLLPSQRSKNIRLPMPVYMYSTISDYLPKVSTSQMVVQDGIDFWNILNHSIGKPGCCTIHDVSTIYTKYKYLFDVVSIMFPKLLPGIWRISNIHDFSDRYAFILTLTRQYMYTQVRKNMLIDSTQMLNIMNFSMFSNVDIFEPLSKRDPPIECFVNWPTWSEMMLLACIVLRTWTLLELSGENVTRRKTMDPCEVAVWTIYGLSQDPIIEKESHCCNSIVLPRLVFLSEPGVICPTAKLSKVGGKKLVSVHHEGKTIVTENLWHLVNKTTAMDVLNVYLSIV